MTKITIAGFDQIKSTMEALPMGNYKCKVTGCEQAVSAKGDAYIAWNATVIEGEFAGRKLFWNTSLKENALFNLKRCTEALNAPIESDGFNTEDMLGRDLVLAVTVEMYEGKERNRVTDYLPVA